MSDKKIYEEIVRIHQTGGTAALVTVVGTEGSTPRKPGAKMLVFPDGRTVGTIGGGCIDRRVYSEVARVFEEGRPRLFRYELDGEVAAELGMICGGRMEVFVERIDAEPRVVLFGGGHVGKTLAHLCVLCGFKVTVVDDREEFAKTERFPDAHEVVLEAFSRAGERVGRYGAPFVVVVTRGHAHDHEVLVQALRESTRYVGVLGSKHKIAALFQALVKAGIPEERVAEVRSPIGLDLGAQTPEEIALAICAELVAVRYGRAGGPLCDTRDAPRGTPIPDEPGPGEAAVAAPAAAVAAPAAGLACCEPGCCPSGDDAPGGAPRVINARVPAWRVVVRGAGEMATGVAHRLFRAGLQVVLLEREHPTAIRRAVAFSEAVFAGRVTVEGVAAMRCDARFQVLDMAAKGAAIPLLVDPDAAALASLGADALVDARMLKRDPGPRPAGADGVLLVGLGPGHVAGESCDFAVETERGHTLGRVIDRGPTLPYSGAPHEVGGHTTARLLRAPCAGTFHARVVIGDVVAAGAPLGEVEGMACAAGLAGLVRGLLPDGAPVAAGQKLGDVDPRGPAVDHRLISDKARAVAGGALEAVFGGLGGRLGRACGRAP